MFLKNSCELEFSFWFRILVPADVNIPASSGFITLLTFLKILLLTPIQQANDSFSFIPCETVSNKRHNIYGEEKICNVPSYPSWCCPMSLISGLQAPPLSGSLECFENEDFSHNTGSLCRNQVRVLRHVSCTVNFATVVDHLYDLYVGSWR